MPGRDDTETAPDAQAASRSGVSSTARSASGGRARTIQSDHGRDSSGFPLAGALERLMLDARNACRREGIAATRRELFARVAKRSGLPQAEVARRLRGKVRRGDLAEAPEEASAEARDPIPLLAATILGAREREVFLARRNARPDDIAALRQLASRLGISVERVYQLEASARRKLACALA
jgi:DNA-binding CsgD family transcriptional regulator